MKKHFFLKKNLLLKEESLFLIFILILFLIILNLNQLYPTYIDDWDYDFIYSTNNKLSSVFDIIPSMKTHYTMWGGRLVVHSLLQEFLYFGPFWADLFNSLMFILYLLLIYKISNINNKINPYLILIVFLLTWFFQADLGESILWMTGSANYLWGTTILLTFLYPYYIYLNKAMYGKNNIENEGKPQKFYLFLFFVAGILAGWTNENMVVAIGAIILLSLLYIWKKERKVKSWSVSGLIGFCIGAILMFIAPGNFKRYKHELKLRGIHDGKPTIDFYIDNLHTLLDGIFHYLLVLIAIYLVFLLIFYLTTEEANRKKVILLSLLFLGASFIATFAMVASPVFKPRTWFGIISLVLIAIMIIISNLNFSKKYISISTAICLVIGVFLFIRTYTDGRDELILIRNIVDEREVEVNRQKAEGIQDIVLHISRFKKRDDLIIPKMYDFPEDPDHWMFKAYAHYHEVNSVRVIENE